MILHQKISITTKFFNRSNDLFYFLLIIVLLRVHLVLSIHKYQTDFRYIFAICNFDHHMQNTK